MQQSHSTETEEALAMFGETDLAGKILNPAEKLREFISNLQAELNSEFPALAEDMSKIRKCIQAAPELAHELTEEEQRTIFAGMQHLQGIALVPEKPKKEKVAKVIGEDKPKKEKPTAEAKVESLSLPPPPETTAPETKTAAQARLAALLAKRKSGK